ncbi:DNA primase [Ureaplasma ceti]|uniref:DNA primase n=1 Tax=Ureaplasma ceti TaxID=3119530 RepID=A0ABP9U5Y5_9BACT
MANNLIDQIKALDIVEVIQNYLQLNKKGANFWGICPFHNDTNASLSVNPQRQMFKCFTCNVAGDAINFVSRLKDISYVEAAIQIGKDFHISAELIKDFSHNHQFDAELQKAYQLNNDFLELAKMFLNQKQSPGLEYVTARGLDSDIIKHFGIGYCPNTSANEMYKILTNEGEFLANPDPNKVYNRQQMLDNGLVSISDNGTVLDLYRGRVIFSIKDDNDKVVGFSGRAIEKDQEPKYLNTPETNLFHKNQILYHWSDVKKMDNLTQVYLVEGFMDVIALYRVGLTNAVAGMGTAFGMNQVNALKKNNIESVVLAYDNDNAGKIAKIKNGLFIAKHFNTFVVKDYANAKDFDELLKNTSVNEVKNTAENMEHFSVYYLKNLQDSLNLKNESVRETYLNEAISFLKEGYANKLYFEEYLKIIVSATDFDEQIVAQEIEFVRNTALKTYKVTNTFKTNKAYNDSTTSSFTSAKTPNRARYQFNNPTYKPKTRVAQANTLDLQASEMAKNKAQYSLLKFYLLDKRAVIIINKYFNGQKTVEFKFLLNLIYEFYEAFPEWNYISGVNIQALAKFIDDNGYDLQYFLRLKELIKKNMIIKAQFDILDTAKAAVQAEICTLKYNIKKIQHDLDCNISQNSVVNSNDPLAWEIDRLQTKVNALLLKANKMNTLEYREKIKQEIESASLN